MAHPETFNYPAFTIEATADRPVRITWINDLVDRRGRYLPHLLPVDPTLHWANPPGGAAGRDSRPTFRSTPDAYREPVPIVTHLHGSHSTEESDGYPEAWYMPRAHDIPPGYATVGSFYAEFERKFRARSHQAWPPGTAVFQYPNDQRAATMWFHDHTLGMTLYLPTMPSVQVAGPSDVRARRWLDRGPCPLASSPMSTRRCRLMLLRLAYLGITNAFALLRMLPGDGRDKDIEILSLHHQLAVLQRQLDGQQVRFEPVDQAWLAALLHPLPRPTLRRLRLLVQPDTILKWHRDLIARRHAAVSRPRRRGRPRTLRSIRALVLRLARENGTWGYRRVHGELLTLGVTVAPSTVWEILREAGIDPAPDRAATTWTDFLRSQAHAVLAADFIETVTLTGARMYIRAVIEHASRRIRVLGVTAHPTAAWVGQAARNLVMDLEDVGCKAAYLIRDRDGKYPGIFDAILADAGIAVVLSGIQMSRMNAIMERWVRTCRRELLDRTPIWNQRQLLHALREYERFYNLHRPHQGTANVRPLKPLPEPITDPDQLARLNIHRHDRLGGVLHEYEHAA